MIALEKKLQHTRSRVTGYSQSQEWSWNSIYSRKFKLYNRGIRELAL